MFQSLDNIAGKGKWSIVDLDFANRKNGVDNARTNENGSREKLYNMLYNIKANIDSKLRKDDFGNLIYDKSAGSVVVDIPGVKWSIAIDKSALGNTAKSIRESLDTFKKTYSSDKYKGIFRELEKHFKTIAESKKVDGKDQWFWKSSDPFAEGSSLETLLTTIQNDAWMKKYWWDHLAEVHNAKNDQAGVKLARRIKMYANTSMRTLSEKQLDQTLQLFESNISKSELNKQESYKGLKKLKKNGGMRIIVARDENFKLGGRQLSGLKELKKQIDAEIASSDKVRNFIEVKEKGGELTFEKGGDFSKVDAYMVVDPRTLAGLMGLNGAGYIGGAGGL